MGISGLLPFLQNASRECHISEFKGCTIAIDSYCWLHKGAFACAEKLIRGETTDMHIQYCLKYINMLQRNGIKVILVFDGQHLPAKKGTEEKRREQRKFARARGTELLRLGKVEEARQYFRQCVDITHDMALNLIKECRKRDVDCVVAPYEADAQLAYLNIKGIAQVIITEDSDLVLFGCSKILFKFNINGNGTLVERDKLNNAMKMRPDQYSFEKFRYMCIMSGCDYLDSLPGVGLKRAHKAVVMTHDPNIYNLLRKLPSYLNLRKLTVSDDYIEHFKLADATVQHQVVYDPTKRMLVRLIDPDECGTNPEYLRNAGQMYDTERALNLALGNIDPISLKVVDNWDPDQNVLSTNSIWSQKYKKSENSQKETEPGTFNTLNVKKFVKKAQDPKLPPSDAALAVIQQAELEQDRKLMEELKIYLQPTKRQKMEPEQKDEQPPGILEMRPTIKNPFLKSHRLKRLSKFQLTVINDDECVRSRFFPQNRDNNESLKGDLDKPFVNNFHNEKSDHNPADNQDHSELICDNLGIKKVYELAEFKQRHVKELLSLQHEIVNPSIKDTTEFSAEDVHNRFAKSKQIEDGRESPVLSFLAGIDHEMKKLKNKISTNQSLKSLGYQRPRRKLRACNSKQPALNLSHFHNIAEVTVLTDTNKKPDASEKEKESDMEKLTQEIVMESQVSYCSEKLPCGDNLSVYQQQPSQDKTTKFLSVSIMRKTNPSTSKMVQPTIVNAFRRMTSRN